MAVESAHMPTLLGTGKIGQFSVSARVSTGFWLAILASFVILVGLYFHCEAYRPLQEARGDQQPPVAEV